MTAKPKPLSGAHAQTGSKRLLPDFWKQISDSRDSAFCSNDQKGGVASTINNDSDTFPRGKNLVIHQESDDPQHQEATIKELAIDGSSVPDMKVFQSPRRDPSSTMATEPVCVAVMQERDQVWLVFPMTKFSPDRTSHDNISTNSTIATAPSDRLKSREAKPTSDQLRESSLGSLPHCCLPHFTSLVPRESWQPFLPSLAFLPAESPLRNLHSEELADLEETLAQSKLIISDGILWHAMPSTSWTTAALPLLGSQQPPLAVRLDWARQCRDIASRTCTPDNPQNKNNPQDKISPREKGKDNSSDGTTASSTILPTKNAESQLDHPLESEPDSLPDSLPDSPCHYLLSVHGLVFPIRALQKQVLHSLAIRREEPPIDWLLDWGEQPVEIDWPEIPTPPEPSRNGPLPTSELSTSTSATSTSATLSIAPTNTFAIQPRPAKLKTKKKHSQQKLFAAVLAGTAVTITLLFCLRFFTAIPKTTATGPAKSNDIPTSAEQSEPAINPNSQPELSELTGTANTAEVDLAEITTTPSLATGDELVPRSPDQIVMQSLATSGISKRPSSTNLGPSQPTSRTVAQAPTALGVETMGGELLGDVEPSTILSTDVQNLIDPERTADINPVAPQLADGAADGAADGVADGAADGVADGDLVLDPQPGEPLFIIPATKAFQRVQLKTYTQPEKIETDTVSKNSPCWAQLKLSDEAIRELEIQPSEFEVALSDAPAKWRLTIDDVVPELHVYLLTKPGRRWYFMVQIGVHFPGDILPTPLGRDDAGNVVLKLQAHQQWLTQSIETLRNSPFPKRVPGHPDVFTQIRELQSQQKATTKAIEQWKEVARLCHELFSYGSVAITLNEPPPSIPNEDHP